LISYAISQESSPSSRTSQINAWAPKLTSSCLL